MIGMNWGIAGATIAYLMLVCIMSLQPYINARMVLFGVFVPEGFRDHKKVREMKKSFTIIVWLTSVATAAIVLGLGQSVGAESAVLILIIIALQPLSTLLVLWRFRDNALRLKNEQNWQAPPDAKRVASLNFPRRKSTIGDALFSFHLIIVAICVMASRRNRSVLCSTLTSSSLACLSFSFSPTFPFA
jgi:hypothetical protein